MSDSGRVLIDALLDRAEQMLDRKCRELLYNRTRSDYLAGKIDGFELGYTEAVSEMRTYLKTRASLIAFIGE